ncbi:MAG: hypothetical protein ABF804_04210 [Liquorilactobacillus ghanensis]|uniref:hypothetical protein n=1 Tax=Liquorilactobacillus ghanensis TaxID=399370 RepID=UPI0039ECAE17
MNYLINILAGLLTIILLVLGLYLFKQRQTELFQQAAAKNHGLNRVFIILGTILIVLAILTAVAILLQSVLWLALILICDAVIVILVPFLLLAAFPQNR